MGEIEANRDYYGPARFDDVTFQLSPRGQQLQARFIENYAERLQENIESEISLPAFSAVSRPEVDSQDQVRKRGAVEFSSGADWPEAPDRTDIQGAVGAARQQGTQRIRAVSDGLESKTKDAKGASEAAADGVKDWGKK
jgi:conjugal transfer mating pair stabilization protein TraG